MDRLQLVAKEIRDAENSFDMNLDQTLREVLEKFYNIMRKHNIAHGTKQEDGGVLQANFEWTLCKAAFLAQLEADLNFYMVFHVPEDLEC